MSTYYKGSNKNGWNKKGSSNKEWNNNRSNRNNSKYIESKEKFVNPYNFVPVTLGKNKTAKSGKSDETLPLFTGYFECRIKCRTPLAIPDACHKEGEILSKGEQAGDEKKADKVHYNYPFYRAGGDIPIIPGSSIRGVIRSVYETLTDSCFGTMQEDTYITARSGSAFKPGLLMCKDDVWSLYKAERRLLVIDRKFYDLNSNLSKTGIKLYDQKKLAYKTGDEVHFILSDQEYRKQNKRTGKEYPIGNYVKEIVKEGGNNIHTGYFCAGEEAPKRHFASIFEKGGLVEGVSIDKQDFQRIKKVLEDYRNKSINRKYDEEKGKGGHKGYQDYEKAEKKGIIPIYYDVSRDGKLYLTFAAIGRKAFYNTLNQAAGERSHQKCNRRDNYCPACALFGTVEGEKQGSKVRFTDAVCTNYKSDMIEKSVLFPELSSPKISYTPFYMMGSSRSEDYLEGYDSDCLCIRGRKFYWHHIPKKINPSDEEKNERNASFDVLLEGAQFQFRVYFDNITEMQMYTLAEAIHLDENNLDGRKCHKLGHGKPLGYGSAKIIVEKCCIRTYDAEAGWRESVEKPPCEKRAICGKDTYNSLMTICDFNSYERFKEIGGAEVEYPSVKKDGKRYFKNEKEDENIQASHQWFSDNFNRMQKTPELNRALPSIMDEVNEKVKFLTKIEVNPDSPAIKNLSSVPANGSKKGPHK